jgi:hypothetical protein
MEGLALRDQVLALSMEVLSACLWRSVDVTPVPLLLGPVGPIYLSEGYLLFLTCLAQVECMSACVCVFLSIHKSAV